jgi:hypothetical protein
MKKIVLLVLGALIFSGCNKPEPVFVNHSISVAWMGKDPYAGTMYFSPGEFVRLEATLYENWSDGLSKAASNPTSFDWEYQGTYKIVPKQGGNQGQFFDVESFPDLGKDNLERATFTVCMLRNSKVCKTVKVNLSSDK